MAPDVEPPVRGGGIVLVQQDCHANTQTHYVQQLGRSVSHRHRASDCAIIIQNQDSAGPAPADCHSTVQQHFVPGYGTVVHRHVGGSCAIQIYEEYQGGSTAGCIQLGPVRVCP